MHSISAHHTEDGHAPSGLRQRHLRVLLCGGASAAESCGLGFAVRWELGDCEAPGTVFFLGKGLLEVTERSEPSGFHCCHCGCKCTVSRRPTHK
ncbi:hypothetical protein GCM10027440_05630 [Nocardiopsis coralliicola]